MTKKIIHLLCHTLNNDVTLNYHTTGNFAARTAQNIVRHTKRYKCEVWLAVNGLDEKITFKKGGVIYKLFPSSTLNKLLESFYGIISSPTMLEDVAKLDPLETVISFQGERSSLIHKIIKSFPSYHYTLQYHGYGQPQWLNWLENLLLVPIEKKTFLFIAHFFVHIQTRIKYLKDKIHISGKKITFQNVGVDFDKFRPTNRTAARRRLGLPQDAFIMLYVGGLVKTKGVDKISEEMPEEFIKTNILGSLNVKKAALINHVPLTVSISSDKAVDPTNLMGLTKSIQEKIFASHSLKDSVKGVKFITVRFGNVIGTHGSLFPIIYHQIANSVPMTITNQQMTRFYMSQKEAIDLIFWAAMHGQDGEIIIKKMKSATIQSVITNFSKILKHKKKITIKNIGIRVGEKMHESLITEDNLYRTREKNGYFIVSPYRISDIISDELLIDDRALEERKKFNSNNPNNFLTEKEMQTYITDFISQQSSEKGII